MTCRAMDSHRVQFLSRAQWHGRLALVHAQDARATIKLRRQTTNWRDPECNQLSASCRGVFYSLFDLPRDPALF